MAFAEATLDFEQGQVKMIVGENLDDTFGADSNGSGKSTLMLGVRMALTDQPEKGKTKDDYIRWGTKEAIIKLTLANEVLNKTMVIERIYNLGKKSNKVSLMINDEKRSFISPAVTNEKIIDALGVSKPDLLNYFLIAQGNQHLFFESSDNEKKSVISRFLGLDILDLVSEVIKEDKATWEALIQEGEFEIKKLQLKIEQAKESIADLDKMASHQKTREKLRIKGLISSETRAKNRIQTNITKQRRRVELFEKDIKDFDPDEMKVLKAKFAKCEKTIKEKNGELLESRELLVDAKGQSKAVTQCPKCLHKFSTINGKIDVKDLNGIVDYLNNHIGDLSVQIKVWKDEKLNVERKLNKLNRLEKSAEVAKSSIVSLTENLDLLEQELKEKDQVLEELEQSLVELEQKEVVIDQNKKEEYEKRIVGLENEIKTLEKEIRKNKKSLEDVEYWKINMGNKGFRSWVINKMLKVLEAKLNLKLQEFKLSFRVQLNGFKELKSGQLKEQITLKISRDGVNWRNFNSLSGGQKMRVSLSTILVIQDMINQSSYQGGGLDFLGLDETFEGLDQTGQKLALKLLDQSNRTVMVVSHQQNNTSQEYDFVTVRFKNDKSFIVR